MSDCLFCRIVAGNIPCHRIWEDKNHLAFLDIHPLQEGHTLVIPKTHTSELFEMEDEAYQALCAAAKHVAIHLKSVLHTSRIGAGVEGFAVDHVHIHLVPITEANQMDSTNASPADPAYLAELAKKLAQ